MQRLNTSKVANVGAKAKVWPDKQRRRAVWLSGAELVGFWKMQKPRRREGESSATILRPRSRSGHGMHGVGKELSERKAGRMFRQCEWSFRHTIPYTRIGMGPLGGCEGTGKAVNGHSDADVSGHCFRVRVYGRCNSEARFEWKGMFAQPHRWRIDQSSSDGSHMLERSLVLGGAKNACSDITLPAKGEDWAERARPGRL
jgi:hypothetical protein